MLKKFGYENSFDIFEAVFDQRNELINQLTLNFDHDYRSISKFFDRS